MADGMTLPLPILGAILGAIAGSQLGDARELAMSLSAAGGVAGFLSAVGLRRLRPAATRRGSGRFRNLQERRAFQQGGGIIIGRDTDTGRLLRHDGPAHLLTVAPTRAGKGTGAILPNLPTLDRPAIVIDPKGENFRVSARQRSTFGPVQALDPFGILGSAAGRLNPLDSLDVRSDNCAEDAAAQDKNRQSKGKGNGNNSACPRFAQTGCQTLDAARQAGIGLQLDRGEVKHRPRDRGARLLPESLPACPRQLFGSLITATCLNLERHGRQSPNQPPPFATSTPFSRSRKSSPERLFNSRSSTASKADGSDIPLITGRAARATLSPKRLPGSDAMTSTRHSIQPSFRPSFQPSDLTSSS